MVFLTEPRDSAGRPLAVYGFAVSLEQVGSALMRPSLESFPLVPQAHPAGCPTTRSSP